MKQMILDVLSRLLRHPSSYSSRILFCGMTLLGDCGVLRRTGRLTAIPSRLTSSSLPWQSRQLQTTEELQIKLAAPITSSLPAIQLLEIEADQPGPGSLSAQLRDGLPERKHDMSSVLCGSVNMDAKGSVGVIRCCHFCSGGILTSGAHAKRSLQPQVSRSLCRSRRLSGAPATPAYRCSRNLAD